MKQDDTVRTNTEQRGRLYAQLLEVKYSIFGEAFVLLSGVRFITVPDAKEIKSG